MIDPELVAELRESFIDGATPSELMYRIALRHEGDSCLHFILRDNFREAFGIPLLRNVVSDEDYSPAARHAHYNRDVVPEMIQRISDWNTADLTGSWLENVSVCSLVDHVQRIKSYPPEELKRVWDDLSEKEKAYVRQQAARINQSWEVAKSLAQLAERLQQKVLELEERLKRELLEKKCPKKAVRPKKAQYRSIDDESVNS